MARETKIGLLAGLAFIICFAIILSHRGHNSKQSPTMLQRSIRTTRGKPAKRPSMVSPSPVDLTLTDSISVPSDQRADQRVSPFPFVRSEQSYTVKQAEDDRGSPPVSGADVNLPNWITTSFRQKPGSQLAWQRESLPSKQPATTDRATTASLVKHPNNTPSGIAQPMGAREQRRLLKQRLRELKDQGKVRIRRDGDPTRSAQPTTPISTEPPSPMQNFPSMRESRVVTREANPLGTIQPAPKRITKKVGVRYTVVTGDTLTKIAYKHYGRHTQRYVDAIFNANRKVLPDPDTLKVGMELCIPDPGNTSQADPVHPANDQPHRRSPETATRTNPHGKQDFRWYQIRRNDRYVTIARKQLGDANRWRELYELNRDKFPDPQRIREGVRIKIPTRSGRKTSGSGP